MLVFDSIVLDLKVLKITKMQENQFLAIYIESNEQIVCIE